MYSPRGEESKGHIIAAAQGPTGTKALPRTAVWHHRPNVPCGALVLLGLPAGPLPCPGGPGCGWVWGGGGGSTLPPGSGGREGGGGVNPLAGQPIPSPKKNSAIDGPPQNPTEIDPQAPEVRVQTQNLAKK